MSSEGSREIEAARKRHAAAKAQVSEASEMTEKANAMIEAAKSMKQSANAMTQRATKEVKDAQQMLADAKKQWEIIGIDQQEPDLTVNNVGSKKRRKVSLNNSSAATYTDAAGNTSMRTSQSAK